MASERIAGDPVLASRLRRAMRGDVLFDAFSRGRYSTDASIYQAEPIRTMVYAEYMAKAGFIKPMPKSWKDYFFPLLHDRNGS